MPADEVLGYIDDLSRLATILGQLVSVSMSGRIAIFVTAGKGT